MFEFLQGDGSCKQKFEQRKYTNNQKPGIVRKSAKEGKIFQKFSKNTSRFLFQHEASFGGN